MRLFASLSKVEEQDDGSIKVFGLASTGARDDAGEIVSPSAMKAALPDYMRWGAIREMHQQKAAGTAVEARVDEDGCTQLVAHVVDPAAVAKVKAGVYKGFSIGGKVLARDPKDPTVITAIKLVETSLVDRPCNPEASINMWKAGELSEAEAEDAAAAEPSLAQPPGNDAVKARAEALAKAAGKPGRRNDFLVAAREALTLEASAREALARAALSDHVLPSEPIAKAKDAADVDADDLSTDDERRDDPDGDDRDAGDNDAGEGASSAADPSPADAVIDGVIETLQDLRAAPDTTPEDAAGILRQLSDALRAMADAAASDPDESHPAPPPEVDDLTRAAETDTLKKTLADQGEALARALADLEILKAQPLPPRTAGSSLAKVVDKVEDAGGFAAFAHAPPARETMEAWFAALPHEDRVQLSMKAALGRPLAVGR